ncbi:hypothetical protein M413DRAFT_440403 [Hebeloma cylindrosporum]|uniref:Uncharacterized protein n=1 Tax=Hebeloma cylindrosporum TaxID=76867 RepID=A0A0C3CDH2_HEBCY|nr:hypothetical protein M413DRAFT_440403 [Hebeloma cylindrosporum h7]
MELRIYPELVKGLWTSCGLYAIRSMKRRVAKSKEVLVKLYTRGFLAGPATRELKSRGGK